MWVTKLKGLRALQLRITRRACGRWPHEHEMRPGHASRTARFVEKFWGAAKTKISTLVCRCVCVVAMPRVTPMSIACGWVDGDVDGAHGEGRR